MEYNKSLINSVILTEEKIKALLKEKSVVTIAIDGRCGSGKSTFAELLSKKFDCNVFHMDDFYLPLEKRTKERLDEAGGNIDRQRFLKEVIVPARNGEAVFYKAFDCKVQSLKPTVTMKPKSIVITEGSYSCHNDFYDLYDLHIFLTVSPEIQKERIIKRNGEDGYKAFENKWIPFEERYFKEQDVKSKCELVFEMG
ncbi:MAG: AAA family ATPase [Clostridia bacterium]|nr:AAA family ATPase [Clostridia bacterium]MBQ6838183.1 AAA family ATPase [Clostridia bacterium]